MSDNGDHFDGLAGIGAKFVNPSLYAAAAIPSLYAAAAIDNLVRSQPLYTEG